MRCTGLATVEGERQRDTAFVWVVRTFLVTRSRSLHDASSIRRLPGRTALQRLVGWNVVAIALVDGDLRCNDDVMVQRKIETQRNGGRKEKRTTRCLCVLCCSVFQNVPHGISSFFDR